MTAFELFLLDHGYDKFILNTKTLKLEEVPHDHYSISSMGNLDYRYVHIYGDLENPDDQIVFGLNELEKPPTLISPRPKIRVKRFRDGQVITEDETHDDSMNVILGKIPHDLILQAMYDHEIVFNVDLSHEK